VRGYRSSSRVVSHATRDNSIDMAFRSKEFQEFLADALSSSDKPSFFCACINHRSFLLDSKIGTRSATKWPVVMEFRWFMRDRCCYWWSFLPSFGFRAKHLPTFSTTGDNLAKGASLGRIRCGRARPIGRRSRSQTRLSLILRIIASTPTPSIDLWWTTISAALTSKALWLSSANYICFL
jgi:hypothetical protein